MNKKHIYVLGVLLSLIIILIFLNISNSVSADENRTTDFQVEILGLKTKEIKIGGTADFLLNISNNGNMVENFSFEVYPEGSLEGWFADIEFLELNINSNNYIQNNVNIINVLKQSPGFYKFIFRVSSLDNQSSPDYIDDFYINLKPFYNPVFIGQTYYEIDVDSTNFSYLDIEMQLKNEGTALDTIYVDVYKNVSKFNLYWVGLEPPKPPVEDFLDPGETSEPYNLKLEIPSKTISGNYFLELYLNSSKDSSNNKIVHIVIHVNELYKISKNVINEIGEISFYNEPPFEAEFQIFITNEGNTKTDLILKYERNLPSFWASIPGSSGRLIKDMEPNETRQESIIIKVDDESEEGIYGDLIFQAYPKDIPSEYINIELIVKVNEFRKIRLKYASVTAGTIEPVDGKNKATMAIDIYNDGNVDDDILLKIDTNTFYTNYPNALKWTDIAFYTNEEMETKITSKQVFANNKETIYLGIELPTGVDNREWVAAGPYTIPISGESKDDPNINAIETVEMIIRKVSEVNVDYTSGQKKIDPGKTFSFIVKVENYGNEKDSMIFDIIDTNDWANELDQFYQREFTEGEKREIKLNLTVPTIDEDDNAQAGNYYIDIEVKPKSGGTKQVERLDYEITETYGAKIELIDKIKNETLPFEGTELSFKAKVSNLGNSKVTMIMPRITSATNYSNADFANWDVFIESSILKDKKELAIEIEPTESKDITVIIDIHKGGYFNTFGLLIRAYPEGKIRDEAEPKTIWLTLREPIYKLAWTESSKNQDKIVEPEDDTQIEYTIYVENLGMEDDRITVRVEPLGTDLKGWNVKLRPAWGGNESSSISGISIEDGDILIFTVVVEPDEKSDRDTYDIEITVESEIDTTATDKLLIQTTVKRPDIQILSRDIRLPDDVKEGDLAQITVLVSNEGDAKARDVEVTFYTDIDRSEEIDFKIITIPKDSSATVVGDWDVDGGKYHITIVADEDNEIIEVNEDNNRATGETLDVRQDLVISDIEIEEKTTKGKTVKAVITVWNNGLADVRNIKCTLYAGSDKIGDATITTITAGSSDIAEIEWKIPNDKDYDSYNLKAEVPTSFGGQDDPTPRDNKFNKTITVYDSGSQLLDGPFSESVCFIFLIITAITILLIILFKANEKNKKELIKKIKKRHYQKFQEINKQKEIPPLENIDIQNEEQYYLNR